MNYTGVPVSAGIAIGEVYKYRRYVPEICAETTKSPEEELAEYQTALIGAEKELKNLQAFFEAQNDAEKAAIFAAHEEILMDETMDEEIRDSIGEGVSASMSISTVFETYARVFEELDDPLIRERAADMRDVRGRLLRCLAGVPEQNLSALSRPVIIVAEDLVPSDTATLDRKNVIGIVTEIGGSTSHSAIIARSYEIPAVLGVSHITEYLFDHQEMILDAEQGVIITDFTEETRVAYLEKREKLLARREKTKHYINCEPVTPDGARILVELNIASTDPQSLESAKYTDGVGLFRSEFLYMGHASLPSEEEQFQTYRKVLMTYGERPVILRTLDIGGDKQLDCLDLPREDNPFLGNRALRLCFQHPDMFNTQLRAALRASVYGNLWIMFPMVASLEDVRRAKKCLKRAKQELRQENIPFSDSVKVGIMIEIPSIALMADIVAKEVDFASIGTNDLTQYCTAVDRGNPEISSYYQTFHPALFRLIGHVVREFSALGKSVGVCGEMGGNIYSAAVLMGLGMRQLSMGAASVPQIKELICNLSCEKAKEIAETVCRLETALEVENYLKEQINF